MIKNAILLINILGFFFLRLLNNDGVTITPMLPQTAKTGSEFTVELKIVRSGVEGFAKLQQELPKGFTAEVIEAKDASFSFSNGILKFIWTSLPPEEDFKISYKIKIAPNIIGYQVWNGKFSYVLDNAKQTVDVPELKIDVQPTEVVKPLTLEEEINALKTNTNDSIKAKTDSTVKIYSYKENDSTAESNSNKSELNYSLNNSLQTNNNITGNVYCKRVIKKINTNEYSINIDIRKNNIVGFAKLQENIPAGFIANPIKITNASFTFVEDKAKFVWISLPNEETFSISYTLKTINKNLVPDSLTGVFSYIENDETKKYTIPTSNIIVENNLALNSSEKTETKTDSASNSQLNDSSSQTITQSLTTTNSTTNTNTNETTKEETSTNSNSKEDVVATIPAPQSTIYYSIQLAAVKKAVATSYFKTIHKIEDKINLEMHEGWTKYTTGSFTEYKQARDYREVLKTKKINGPFVTAYNYGKRITVQEALMITSQKWYR